MINNTERNKQVQKIMTESVLCIRSAVGHLGASQSIGTVSVRDRREKGRRQASSWKGKQFQRSPFVCFSWKRLEHDYSLMGRNW